MKELPLFAVVPNYNMGEQLHELLPVLMDAGYDDLYVLDNSSTDDSRDVVKAISTDIHFVIGETNVRAGANRNRILRAIGQSATLHFLDADVKLDTVNVADTVKEALPTDEYGFMGGLARTASGFQNVYNYGPRQSLYADIGANVQSYVQSLLPENQVKAKSIRERFSRLLADWPDPLSHPVRRQVYWAVEQNLVINSDTFASVGGFDETLREHEIQDFAIRMAKCG